MKTLILLVSRYFLCAAMVLVPAAVSRYAVSFNSTTAALYLLLVVLGTATKWGLGEAIFSSIGGMLAFNFFFLPPVRTFTITDPENLVALFAFLITAITASQLSARAKNRAREALMRSHDISRLYELSRALLMEDDPDKVRQSVVKAGKILNTASIALYDAATRQIYGSIHNESVHGPGSAEMAQVVSSGEGKSVAGFRITPVRMGTSVIGSLTTREDEVDTAVAESAAGLLAINYERTMALDRAAAAEAARQNEEFKSSLLDGLAHDLKTPLTAIRTCVTTLITIPPRTEEVRQELLAIIDQESVRLQATITEAIELARVESGEVRLERERLRVSELIQDAVAETRDEASERYITRVDRSIEIECDRVLCRRALTQILENAAKYSPPGSPIEVEAHAADGEVTVQVMDRGPGIPHGELKRVFEKFYRGKGRKSETEGTGMGLAIAKSIVGAHGGSIRADGRPDGGTIISVTLPAGRT